MDRTGTGGNEVLEGLLLAPLLLSFGRHLSRELTLGLTLDLDKVEFFVTGVIRLLEAQHACAPRRSRAPSETDLGSHGTGHQLGDVLSN